MHGSIFFILSTLELIGTTANPQLAKDAKSPPNVRQVESDVADISGYYTCKGKEAGGKSYSGICVLTKKGEVYLISWVVGGGANFNGIAIRQDNNLAASWAIGSDKGIVRGVNLYRIESAANGPRLIGRWSSVPGPGVQQEERLTFLKKLEAEEEE